MRLGCFILSLFCFASVARGQEAPECRACREPITGRYLIIKSAALAEPVPVCETCSQLPARCFVCSVPAKVDFRALSDGRVLCQLHADDAVLSPREAERIFEGAKRDIIRMFRDSGTMPERNMTVTLVDAKEMRILLGERNDAHGNYSTLGMTRTRQLPGQAMDHRIYLLSGLNRARLMAISAHEYAHVWLHENVKEDREIDADTIEGFCELVAYKLMLAKNEQIEKQVILANAYTRGQINTLIKAADDFRFYRVLDWFRAGADNTLSQTNITRLLALEARPASGTIWGTPSAATAVPETLMLKGISGTARRRFALVNDQTLQTDETSKVRVGTSNVVVRCLSITERSVTLELPDSSQTIELFLREME